MTAAPETAEVDVVEAGGAGRPRRSRRALRTAAIVVASALALSWVAAAFLVRQYVIPSTSMEGTLEVGDRVVVSRLVPDVLDVHRGDIVVFRDPGGWLSPLPTPDRGPLGNALVSALTAVGLRPADADEHLIKRVIGLPGDHVTCCDVLGRVMINGMPITETDYLAAGAIPSEVPFDVVVPDGMLFVLGDNRQSSADSRSHLGNPGGGFVPVDDVVGAAFATVAPLDRVTWHRNPADVFAQVSEP